MNNPEINFRKVAIVVSALSPQEADRFLERFPPEQAERVRQAIMELGAGDSAEEQRVLEEFLQAQSPSTADDAGVELDAGLARLLGATPPAPADKQTGARPFSFLRDAEADKLAGALAGERPQMIALVLAHLRSEQAAAVLVRLEAARQAEVIRRLVDLEETDAEILQEVERALQSRLSQQLSMQRRRTAGVQALRGILQASPPQLGAKILDNLARHDRALAEKFAPQPIDFDDLLLADDSSWGEILREAGAELVMLALIGAAPRLIERILRHLSPPEAAIVRRRLDHPGPTRLSDVEQARRQVAHVAARLIVAGRCRLSANKPSPNFAHVA